MHINKNLDTLVLYRYPFADTISVINNNAKILEEREKLFELGYLRLDDYTKTMKYNDMGNETMFNIYLENKKAMIAFIEKHNGKFTEEMFCEELDEQGVEHCDYWIDFFLAKLKNDKVITQYDSRDNDKYICYFN